LMLDSIVYLRAVNCYVLMLFVEFFVVPNTERQRSLHRLHSSWLNRILRHQLVNHNSSPRSCVTIETHIIGYTLWTFFLSHPRTNLHTLTSTSICTCILSQLEYLRASLHLCPRHNDPRSSHRPKPINIIRIYPNQDMVIH